jgi:hypothetical protein
MGPLNKCWVCGTTQNLESHHCFGGCRRKTSEEYGLKIWLCQYHHQIVTDEKNKELVHQIHLYGQTKFERENPDLSFLETFNKFYF